MRMRPNTLSFRGVQNGFIYAYGEKLGMDADNISLVSRSDTWLGDCHSFHVVLNR